MPSAIPAGEVAGEKLPCAIPAGEVAGEKLPCAIPAGEVAGEKLPCAIPTGEVAGEHLPCAIPTGEVAGEHLPRAIPTGEVAGEHLPCAIPTGEVAGENLLSAIPAGEVARKNLPCAIPAGEVAGTASPDAFPAGETAGERDVGRIPTRRAAPQRLPMCWHGRGRLAKKERMSTAGVRLVVPTMCAALAFAGGCSTSSGAAPAAEDAGHAGDGAADVAVDAAPTGPASCTVAAKGTSGTLLHGRLLLPAGPTTGELLINAAGVIVCAEASCASAAGYAAATSIVCDDVVISPGLINTHDHISYATSPPGDHGTIRYQHRDDWRLGAEGAMELTEPKDDKTLPVMAAQELRLVLGGGTSVLATGSDGVPGLARDLGEYQDMAELQGLTDTSAYFDTFPLGDESGELADGGLITSGCAYPAIQMASYAFSGTAVYAPHIAEGINLAAQNEFVCASQASNDLVTAKTALIHAVGMNAKNVAAVAKAGSTLVWAPRSNVSLYGDTAPVTEYKYAGVTIALGTDWLFSGSMNMLRELACADSMNKTYFDGAFTDAELWAMATANGAAAAGFGNEIGALTAGMVADVAVFDASTNTDYRAVIAAGAEDVHLVLRGGTPLYGDAELVGALQTGCTPLEVCGNARVVCDDVPGTSLAAIQAATQGVYPLFFCKGTAPTAEPSCVPYRDTYPDGITSTDKDGDGVPDAKDDCPSIFNPIRPMDGAKQADQDADGYGDACDAFPLDATKH